MRLLTHVASLNLALPSEVSEEALGFLAGGLRKNVGEAKPELEALSLDVRRRLFTALLTATPKSLGSGTPKKSLHSSPKNIDNKFHTSDDPYVEFLSLVEDEDELEATLAALPESSKRVTAIKRQQSVAVSAVSKYSSWVNALADTGLPMTDLILDIVIMYNYYATGRMQFLTIVGVSILANTLISTYCMLLSVAEESHERALNKRQLGILRTLGVLPNLLTLGVFSQVAEGVRCYQMGQKTPTLLILKFCEAVESVTSLLVATYSLLIAGYVDGYRMLDPGSTALRFFSISSSIMATTKCMVDIGRNNLVKGEAEDRARYSERLRTRSGLAALVVFTLSEVAAVLTLPILQLVTRPNGAQLLYSTMYD